MKWTLVILIALTIVLMILAGCGPTLSPDAMRYVQSAERVTESVIDDCNDANCPNGQLIDTLKQNERTFELIIRDMEVTK